MTPAAKPLTTLIFHTRVDCNDGVASYLDSLISGLAGRGDAVLLITGPVTVLHGSGLRQEAIGASVLDWVVIQDLGAVPRPMQVRRILRLMRQHEVDLVFTQGFTLLPYAKLLARLSGLRVIANYHPSAYGAVAADIAPRRSLKARLAYRRLPRCSRRIATLRHPGRSRRSFGTTAGSAVTGSTTRCWASTTAATGLPRPLSAAARAMHWG